MGNKISAVENAVDSLSAYIKPLMPELSQIIHDFPDANTSLKYPSLTISHNGTDASFTPLMPWIWNQSNPDSANRTKLQLIVGMWDFSLQLDFWARNVPERDALFEKFFDTLNAEADPMGLSLQLPNYYNVWARYDLSGFRHFDDGETSQKGIWRTMVNLLVNTSAVREKTTYVMKTIVNQPVLLNTNESIS